MAIPAGPGADLIVVKSEVFGGFKIFLDVPARAPGADHSGERGANRGEDEEKPEQRGIIAAAAHKEPVLAIVEAVLQEGESYPVRQARAFAALAHGEGLPEQRRAEPSGNRAGFEAPSLAIRQSKDDWFLTGNGKDEGEMAAFEKGPQVGITAVDGISDDPGDGDVRAGLQEPDEHGGGQLGFGVEAEGVRDASLSAARAVGQPIGRHVEVAINEGMPLWRAVGQKDADLAVFHLSGAAAPLGFDPGRRATLFGKTGFIEGQDGVLGPQAFQGIGAYIIAQALDIADSAREQALHAVGSGFARVFGQLPARLAFQGTQEAVQKGQCALTWLSAGKTRSNALMQLGQLLRPASDLSQRRCREAGYGKLRGLHGLLLDVIVVRVPNLSMAHQPEKCMKLIFLGEKPGFCCEE